MKISGEIKNGLLVIDREAFKNWVRNQKDCLITLSIRKKGKTRSLNANNLYWARNKVLANEVGYPDVYDQHVDTMERVGLGEYKVVNGKNIFIRSSSAVLNVQDFNLLIEEQGKIAIFLDVRLPSD